MVYTLDLRTREIGGADYPGFIDHFRDRKFCFRVKPTGRHVAEVCGANRFELQLPCGCDPSATASQARPAASTPKKRGGASVRHSLNPCALPMAPLWTPTAGIDNPSHPALQRTALRHTTSPRASTRGRRSVRGFQNGDLRAPPRRLDESALQEEQFHRGGPALHALQPGEGRRDETVEVGRRRKDDLTEE